MTMDTVRKLYLHTCLPAHLPTCLLLGLYRILPSPILYGAWHTKGGSGGRRILRNNRARVFCNGVGNAGGEEGGVTGMVDSCTTASKRTNIS